MSQFILALDQGTTSSRAILFDETGRAVSLAQLEFDQSFPQPGWVEHDPEQIWDTQRLVAQRAIAESGVPLQDIRAIGISNQRETTVLWDRVTGRSISPAIVWQDRRTATMCEALTDSGAEDLVRTRTGLVLDPYFSATKIAWILDHVPQARARAERGELAFGTIDTWLIWHLTQGRQHVTDATNASRTLLFNLHTGTWDPELLQLFKIPPSLLPEIRDSSEVIGSVTADLLGTGGADIPLAGIVGDQQGALFGQLCFTPGATKTTYGTGCFMLQHVGDRAVMSRNRLITTVASRLQGQTSYALEGSVFAGGAVVQWLRDGLGILKRSEDVLALACSVPDNGGVYLVPAFSGLGAPHWDPAARGLIVGLTRGSTSGHIARAALESIAFQVADLFDAMRSDSQLAVPEMRVDGGATRNDLLMQFQADLLGIPLFRPADTESTAWGAAILAGLATGVWKSREDLRTLPTSGTRFEPRMPPVQVERLRDQWSRAVERAQDWER